MNSTLRNKGQSSHDDNKGVAQFANDPRVRVHPFLELVYSDSVTARVLETAIICVRNLRRHIDKGMFQTEMYKMGFTVPFSTVGNGLWENGVPGNGVCMISVAWGLAGWKRKGFLDFCRV